ncbi:hypothetical protein D049_4825 [Vibrio parahaemolyticus VPTS-2010]|nr:hypothetical protein D049_4825 [Vibrio parahaemolyticus VPTS-2010]
MSSTQRLISGARRAKMKSLLHTHKTNHSLCTHQKKTDKHDVMSNILFAHRKSRKRSVRNAKDAIKH